MSLGMRWDVRHSMFRRSSDGQERRLSGSLGNIFEKIYHVIYHVKYEKFERFEIGGSRKRARRDKEKSSKPLKIKDFELLLAGSGRRIRIIKAGEIKEN